MIRSTESLTLTRSEGHLDVFGRGPESAVTRRAVAQSRIFDLDGSSVPTLTLAALIASRVAAAWLIGVIRRAAAEERRRRHFRWRTRESQGVPLAHHVRTARGGKR